MTVLVLRTAVDWDSNKKPHLAAGLFVGTETSLLVKLTDVRS